jgi:hypothetical protein
MALSAEGGRRKWEGNFPVWVEKCNTRHGNRYSYPSMERLRCGTAWKVRIVCAEHGEFLQAPEKHAFGQGCPMCDGKGVDKVAALRSLFPDFDFADDLVIKGSKTKFALTCPEHGEFKVIYNNLGPRAANGLASPCPKCNMTRAGALRRKRGDVWAQQVTAVTGGTVTLNQDGFTTASAKAEFTCTHHGKFFSVLQDVADGHGCPECGRLRRNKALSLDVESFLLSAAAVHGSRYQYDPGTFVNTKVPMAITCAEHGVFYQRPNNHVSNAAGCPKCSNSVSSGEDDLFSWIESTGVVAVQRDRSVLGGKEIDIYLPEHRLGIEYCGLYWHGEDKRHSTYHTEKLDAAAGKGVRLITVFEDEWLDPHVRNLVMFRVLAALGASRSVYARHTSVVSIGWAEAKQFLDTHHMQGAGVPAKVCYALRMGSETVAVSTWGLSRFEKSAQWELFRFSSTTSDRVVGGLGKMFAAFVGDHTPASVVSYADRRWGNGDAYGKIGFEFDGYTAPGYYWCKHLSRFSRHRFQKHKLKGVLATFDPDASEAENCRANGYWRLYDCGHSRWIWAAGA